MLFAFVLAFFVSYILNPYVNALEGLLRCRLIAVCAVIAFLVTLGFLAFLFVLPVLYAQSIHFMEQLPELLNYFYNSLHRFLPSLKQYAQITGLERIESNLSQIFLGSVKFFANQFLKSTVAVVNFFIVAFLTPIITFYYLLDWKKICGTLDSLIPKKYYDTTKHQLKIINNNIAGYIRGQLKVCILLALFYAVFLKLVGLQYSFFIAITSGILSFIPYVGTIFGFVVSHLVALYQFNDIISIFLVTIVFVSGQLIEWFVLTPKLIGKSVNLHPAWVMFAIIFGGEFFGFLGILLAVPTASLISVLVRFAVLEYKKSKYYVAKTTDAG